MLVRPPRISTWRALKNPLDTTGAGAHDSISLIRIIRCATVDRCLDRAIIEHHSAIRYSSTQDNLRSARQPRPAAPREDDPLTTDFFSPAELKQVLASRLALQSCRPFPHLSFHQHLAVRHTCSCSCSKFRPPVPPRRESSAATLLRRQPDLVQPLPASARACGSGLRESAEVKVHVHQPLNIFSNRPCQILSSPTKLHVRSHRRTLGVAVVAVAAAVFGHLQKRDIRRPAYRHFQHPRQQPR